MNAASCVGVEARRRSRAGSTSSVASASASSSSAFTPASPGSGSSGSRSQATRFGGQSVGCHARHATDRLEERRSRPSTRSSRTTSASGTQRASRRVVAGDECGRADRRGVEVEDDVVVRLRSSPVRSTQPASSPTATSMPVSSRTSRATASRSDSPNSTLTAGRRPLPDAAAPPPRDRASSATSCTHDRADRRLLRPLGARRRPGSLPARSAAACA